MQTEDPTLKNFISIADKDMRDAVSGLYEISSGASIIVDAAGNVRLDTPRNRDEFIANGYSFWQKLSPELEENLKESTITACRFNASLDFNIKSNLNRDVPNNNASGFLNLIPAKFKTYGTRETNGEAFYDFLSGKEIVPDHKSFVPSAAKKLISANQFRIHELSSGKHLYRFVIFYVTPIDMQTGELLPADNKTYDALMSYYREWEQNVSLPKQDFTCFVFAAPLQWDVHEPVVGHDKLEVFCYPAEDAQWIVKHHTLVHSKKTYCDLVYSLYPETTGDRCDRIRAYILDNKFIPGNMTVEKLSKNLHIPPSLVAVCCDALQDTGEFFNYMANGHMAIRIRTPEDPVGKKIRFSTGIGLLIPAFVLLSSALHSGLYYSI